MLPPPNTSPTCTPARTTSATCAAMIRIWPGSKPKDSGPASASPLILSRMRRYPGMAEPLASGRYRERALPYARRIARVADFVANETNHVDGIADLCPYRLDQLCYRNRVFANEGLVEQADFFIKFAESPFGDLIHHFFGLPLAQRTFPLDFALFGEERGGHLVSAHGLRMRRRNLHC